MFPLCSFTAFFAGLLFYMVLLRSDKADAQNLTQPFIPGAYWKNKIFAINTNSPVATYMSSNFTAQKLAQPSIDLIYELDAAFQRRRNASHTLECNLPPSHKWSVAAKSKPKAFQVGELVKNCYSFLDLNEAARNGNFSADTLNRIKDSILEGRNALFHALAAGSDVPQDGNWSDPNAPYENISKEFPSIGQTCSLDSITAFQVDGEWYIRVAMTNHPVSEILKLGQRHVVNEWVHHKYSHSLALIHPTYDLDSPLNRSQRLVRGTTILYADKGVIGTTWGAPTKFEDIYGPLSFAYRKSDIETNQGQDSVTLSNIAIIALPMVMNLIPVAFVADFNTMGNLAYIVFTDIASSVPFLVKGVELVKLSQPIDPVATAFFVGNETMAQMEAWVAICKGEDHFGVKGIVFICVAVTLMIVGVTLELLAMAYTRRREKEGKKKYRPFRPGVIDVTKMGLLGAGGVDQNVSATFTNPSKANAGMSSPRFRRKAMEVVSDNVVQGDVATGSISGVAVASGVAPNTALSKTGRNSQLGFEQLVGRPETDAF